MRILIFNFEYPPLGGGGGVATQQLAEELAKQHDIAVITSRHEDLPAREQQGRLVIYRVPVWGRSDLPTASLLSLVSFVPPALWKGARLLSRERCDVINAQFVIPSGIPAALLSLVFRVPFVVSFIGGDVYDPTKGTSPHRHWWLRFLVRLVSWQACAGTAISEDTKRRAVELHGVRVPITVTHLGIIPYEPPPATRAELGLPEQALIFVSVGRLIPRKGYDVLLRVWARTSAAHLLVIGNGPWKQRLEILARDLGITDRVHFMGYVHEERKLQLLRAADVYVSAAEHEGFGIVFLEAMAAGLPIIATNNGGHTDFLQEEVHALLVAPRSEEALLTAIARMMENQELRRQLGERNKIDVRSFFVDVTTRTFETVLAKACGRASQEGKSL